MFLFDLFLPHIWRYILYTDAIASYVFLESIENQWIEINKLKIKNYELFNRRLFIKPRYLKYTHF